MAQLIKSFSDGTVVQFESGKFDAWCVFVIPAVKRKFAPTDIQYFSRLQQLGEKHGHQKIYHDFVSFYTPTTKELDQNILTAISLISSEYGKDAFEVDVWFTVIYAGMVAEENKKSAILKKRIKRLGMHQVLMDLEKPEVAANFSRGKNWRELDALMKSKGF